MPTDWTEHDDLVFANALARSTRRPRGSRAGARYFAAGVPALLGVEDAGERALIGALLDAGVRQRSAREEAALRRSESAADWERRLALQREEWGRSDRQRREEMAMGAPERALRMELGQMDLAQRRRELQTPTETRTPEQIEARANAAKLAWNMMARGQRPSKELMRAAGIDVELPPEAPQGQPSQEFRERVAAGLVEAGDMEGAQHVLRGEDLTKVPAATRARSAAKTALIEEAATALETAIGLRRDARGKALEMRSDVDPRREAARVIASNPAYGEAEVSAEDLLGRVFQGRRF